MCYWRLVFSFNLYGVDVITHVFAWTHWRCRPSLVCYGDGAVIINVLAMCHWRFGLLLIRSKFIMWSWKSALLWWLADGGLISQVVDWGILEIFLLHDPEVHYHLC